MTSDTWPIINQVVDDSTVYYKAMVIAETLLQYNEYNDKSQRAC